MSEKYIFPNVLLVPFPREKRQQARRGRSGGGQYHTDCCFGSGIGSVWWRVPQRGPPKKSVKVQICGKIYTVGCQPRSLRARASTNRYRWAFPTASVIFTAFRKRQGCGGLQLLAACEREPNVPRNVITNATSIAAAYIDVEDGTKA